MSKKYTYHHLIFTNYIKHENKKIYVIPSVLLDNENNISEWGIISRRISVYFLFFGISYEYLIDKYDFYEFKSKDKFKIFGLKFLNKTN